MPTDNDLAVVDAPTGSGDLQNGNRRRFTAAGILLGVGLGGFVDGIVFHQILQWHHMLTDGHTSFPQTTVSSLEENTLWDGLFHAGTWAFVAIGLFLLWHALSAGYRVSWRSLVGLLLVGWGMFNLVEGIIDHHILTIHHVRDDVDDPLWWDLGFLAFGALLVISGLALRRSDRPRRTAGIVTVGGDMSDQHVRKQPDWAPDSRTARRSTVGTTSVAGRPSRDAVMRLVVLGRPATPTRSCSSLPRRRTSRSPTREIRHCTCCRTPPIPASRLGRSNTDWGRAKETSEPES